MCVFVVCFVNVQAEQSKLSRNSWSSKISLESANGCKIYSTLACAASGSVKNRKKKKSWLLPEKSPEVIAAVFTRLCVCVRAAMLPEQGSTAVLGGPSNDQLLLPVHVLSGQTVATAGQDPGHVKGLMQGKKRTYQLFTWHNTTTN